jgi:acyl-CoA thioesterase-1
MLSKTLLFKLPQALTAIAIALITMGTSISTQAQTKRSILVYGDSISAAYGMDFSEGWAQQLGAELDAITLVNASVSGETTGGGLTRLPKALAVHNPDLVVLELGGNDGLRGYPIDRIQNNLVAMVQAIRASGSEVALIGMVLPPNYGQRYLTKFIGMYAAIAESEDIHYFLPALLDGLDTPRDLLQRDGIHPTAGAQPLIKAQIQELIDPWINGD